MVKVSVHYDKRNNVYRMIVHTGAGGGAYFMSFNERDKHLIQPCVAELEQASAEGIAAIKEKYQGMKTSRPGRHSGNGNGVKPREPLDMPTNVAALMVDVTGMDDQCVELLKNAVDAARTAKEAKARYLVLRARAVKARAAFDNYVDSMFAPVEDQVEEQ